MYFSNDKELYSTIGKNIKLYRKTKGMTQIQLCDEVGVSLSYLAKIEADNCDKSFSLSLLNKIANVLEIEVYKFLKQ